MILLCGLITLIFDKYWHCPAFRFLKVLYWNFIFIFESKHDLCVAYLYFQDQKKLQGQLIAEQEALYGSKPSPSKTQGVKKAPRMSTGCASNRKLSVGGTTLVQTPKIDRLSSLKATPHSRPVRKSDRVHLNDRLNLPQDDILGLLPAGKSIWSW